MIESNIIKRYIVKMFMQHSRLGVDEVARTVMSALGTKLFLHESVLVLSTQTPGKISHCSRDTYRVKTDDGQEAEVAFGNLQRRCTVRYEDVVGFLVCVTKQTAFGRILIENVFEKMSQPGFREASGYREYAAGRRMASNQIDDGADQGHHDADSEEGRGKRGREEEARRRPQRPKYEKLDVQSLSQLTIRNFEGELLTDLVKIYMFLASFGDDLGIGGLSAESLGDAIHDPEYDSETAFRIHSVLVDIIENEVKTRRERYLDTLGFVLDGLRPFESECPVQKVKKRQEMTMENWKAQTRLFIQNLSKDLDDDRVQQFYNFHRKDGVDVRVSFLVFLIDIVTVTDRFREFVSSKQNALRAMKSKHDELCVLQKKRGDEEKIGRLEGDLRDYDAFMVNHPLKVHLGSYDSYSAFVMDRRPILRDGSTFYILEKKDVTTILRSLNPHARSNKHLVLNLKLCAETLFK